MTDGSNGYESICRSLYPGAEALYRADGCAEMG
jgi:hypothetical protein